MSARLTIEQLENWLDSFNAITPMAEESKENNTNAGEIVVQLLDTIRDNERLRSVIKETDAFLCKWKMNHVPSDICNTMIAKIDEALSNKE